MSHALELSEDLAAAVEKNAASETVDIGSHITIQEEDFPPEKYHMVGPKEADPRNGKISHESPIGRALMGHRVSDLVDVETPGGKVKFKIVKIE